LVGVFLIILVLGHLFYKILMGILQKILSTWLLRLIKDFHKYIMHSHSYLRFWTFAMYKLFV